MKKCLDRGMIGTSKDQILRDPLNIGEGELQFYLWKPREFLYGIPEDDDKTGWLTEHNL